MKLTNKRLVSILLCLAMVLAMLPMAVFAATDYYLRGDMNGWAADDSNKMTDNGDGTYSITMDLDAGTYEFKGAVADWSWSCPSGGNMTMTLGAADTVTFTLNPTDNSLTYTLASGAEPEVPVVENVTLYCNAPADWTVCYCYWWGSTVENPEWSGKEMTKGDDGIWFISVPSDADNVIFNNGSDQSADLPMPTDDNVQFNYEAGQWGTYGTVVEPPVYDYYVAGVAGLCNGEEWNPGANQMTKGEDGLYTITFENIAAGTYEYKIATGSWETPSYGYGEGNYSVTTEAYLSNVTITFNAETSEANASVEVVAATEPGAADIKWQVPTVSSAEDTEISLRLVSWVDTLDYSNVQFTVTMAGQTGVLDVTTVYQTIYGEAFSAYEPYNVFGDDANYFVTHTITGIPAAYYGEEIEVTVSWYDLDGNLVRTSETRTIVIADNWA